MAEKSDTQDCPDVPLGDLVEMMEAYNFDVLMDEIESVDDIRLHLREMFIDMSNGVPFSFEELAALALVGMAKHL